MDGGVGGGVGGVEIGAAAVGDRHGAHRRFAMGHGAVAGDVVGRRRRRR